MTKMEQVAAEARVRSPREWLIAVLVGVVVSLAVVSPFLRYGNASGHDFDFHASSWLEVAAQWKQHITYPRWHESANHGFGEPRFIFYPPLSWMLGAALGLVVRWRAVPVLFIALTQMIGCVCMFRLARRWLPFRGALAAGALYAANPYALLVTYVRSDFAEQLASAFLPLLFLFAFEFNSKLRRSEPVTGSSVLFAVVFLALWLCNAPAAVLASYTMALLCAWMALAERDWRPLAFGAGSIALGLALAAFYIVPALYEQRWVNIEQVLAGGLRPADNFLYTATSDPEHTLFNYIASTIAVLLIVFTGAGATATFGRRRIEIAAEDTIARRVFFALLAVSGAATLLMLRVSGMAWTLLPKLRFVQFPWRWMLILAVPCAVFVGACAARRWGLLWVAAMMSASVISGVYLARHTWWEPDEMPALEAMLVSGKGFEGTDEYDPAGDDHSDLPQAAPHVRFLPTREGEAIPAAAVSLLRWDAEEKNLRVHTQDRAKVALRLLNYPAWRVEVNGRAVMPEHLSGTAQMVVQVPAGKSEIHVRLVRTADRTIGGAISGIALLIVVFLIVLAAIDGSGSDPKAHEV
jgi:hypothetical protein